MWMYFLYLAIGIPLVLSQRPAVVESPEIRHMQLTSWILTTKSSNNSGRDNGNDENRYIHHRDLLSRFKNNFYFGHWRISLHVVTDRVVTYKEYIITIYHIEREQRSFEIFCPCRKHGDNRCLVEGSLN